MNVAKVRMLAREFLDLELGKTAMFPIITSHPFIESGMVYYKDKFFDATKEENEELFNEYKDFFYDIRIKKSNVNQILLHMSKPYILVFIDMLNQLEIATEEECGNLILDNWTRLEVINNDIDVSKEKIKMYLENADRITFMSKHQNDIDKYNNFEDIITIYRGATIDEKVCGYGLSWTISKEKAVWFAKRFNRENQYLYTAKIKKQDILVYTNSRGEQEVIVDYDKLINVRVEKLS